MAKVGLWLRGARGKYAGGVLQKGVGGGTVVRENVTPSNPQSDSQVTQRMKLAPANQFWRQWSYALDNAFEGLQYGYKSRWQFLRYALKLPAFGMLKGSSEKVALPVRVSSGSLSIAWDSSRIEVADVTSASSTFPESDVSILVEAIGSDDVEVLENFLAEGGEGRQNVEVVIRKMFGLSTTAPAQVAFLTAIMNRDKTIADIWETSGFRIVLDVSHDDEFVNDQLTGFLESIETYDRTPANGTKLIPYKTRDDASWLGGIMALAIITSEFTGDAWRRSNSTMVVDSAYWESMTGTARVEEARKSYQKRYSSASSAYLDNGEEPF